MPLKSLEHCSKSSKECIIRGACVGAKKRCWRVTTSAVVIASRRFCNKTKSVPPKEATLSYHRHRLEFLNLNRPPSETSRATSRASRHVAPHRARDVRAPLRALRQDHAERQCDRARARANVSLCSAHSPSFRSRREMSFAPKIDRSPVVITCTPLMC